MRASPGLNAVFSSSTSSVGNEGMDNLGGDGCRAEHFNHHHLLLLSAEFANTVCIPRSFLRLVVRCCGISYWQVSKRTAQAALPESGNLFTPFTWVPDVLLSYGGAGF